LPTVLRIDGLRVVIYPNDHRPPHVHVFGAEGEAVFLLNCPDGPLDLRESLGFGATALRRMAAALLPFVSQLRARRGTILGSL
jgi:hypothetical protein